jgi:hypothetical protein
MRYLQTYQIFESKSIIKFVKKESKKGAKTETYDVVKSGEVIGQIRWSSRMRGYAFLPEKDHDDEIKTFIKDLMSKRKKVKLVKESRYDDFKEILHSLEDWGMDFKDDGLIVNISPKEEIGIKVRSMNIPTSDVEPFYMEVKKDIRTRFEFKKYINNIISICEYMKSEGYNTEIELRNVFYKAKSGSDISREKISISGDDFTKAEEDVNITEIQRGKLRPQIIIRLDSIETVHCIKLIFDKINKEYDI